MRRSLVFCSALLVTSIAAGRSEALDFDYVKIADLSTPVPVEGSVFASFRAPALDGYQVAFRGNRFAGGGQGPDGLFFSNGGLLTRIAGSTTPIPSGSGNFAGFSDPSISLGNVAFRGVDGGGGGGLSGVYTNINGLNRVADETTTIPSGGAVLFTDLGSPSLNGANVAFPGTGTGQAGIYSNVGGLNAVANLSAVIPGGSGNFTSFGTTPALRDGIVAFLGFGSAGQTGVYTNAAGLAAVANTSTAIPAGTGNFASFTNPTLSGGNVAFRATGAGQNGIYTDAGGLNRVADLTTVIPGGSGNFTSFGDNVTIDEGNVTFNAFGSGQSGIYTNYGGTLAAVVNNATFIDGKRVSGFPVGLSKQAWSRGNATFVATFSDGTSGIYVAEQTYAYAANASGEWDNASNWSFGASPKTVVPTVIRPANGAVITGPSFATTVRGLELGSAGSGVAELRLQTTGQLNVNEFLTIYQSGKLSVNGGVATANFGTFNFGEIDLGGGQLSGGGVYNYGTLHGSGTVGTGVTNINRIQAINAQMRFTSQVQNSDANSHIDARNALLEFDGGLYNIGHVNFSFGTSDVFGDLENAEDGRFIASGNSNVTFYDDVVHHGSEIRVSAGSTAVFFGDVSGPGAFTGSGTVFFEGTYSPGASPASVSLQNDVAFGTNATLQIELGGTAAGAQYDQVHVAGDLSLGGTLDVSLINGFMPSAGDSFDILNWGSLTGTFNALQLPALAGGRQWNTGQLYTSGVLLVISGVLGDYNNDGTVNAADYTVWRNNSGATITLPNEGSGISPGVVDRADFNFWKSRFGATSGSGSAVNASEVPEPATIALLCVGMVGVLGRRICRKA